MSDPDKPVNCSLHGQGIATFTCRHLKTGIACGYHAASDGDPDDDDPWPDAWCSACERVLTKCGGWNDESERFADIQLVCNRCYEGVRERNRDVPGLVKRLGAPASAGEVREFVEAAVHHCQALNTDADNRFDLLRHERWDYDSEAGTLLFSNRGVPALRCDVRLVGSFSTRSKTWLWAWANAGVDFHRVGEMHRLKAFGEIRGIDKLAKERWDAEEEDAWEVTAVAGYLLKAEGVYRAPMDHLMWFMTLHNLRESN